MENTNLQMTRGDDFKITYQIETANDINITEAIFTIKKKTIDQNSLFQKTITALSTPALGTPVPSGEGLWTYSFIIDIAPNDTKDLSFGKYMYDLQIEYAGGLTLTVIKPSVFEIMEEVTWGS